ncbi:conserved hypothetical protein [Shigella boydii Sb227]|nr:conserved hypothetical protein [Shigella boydii Sb227]
MRRNVAGALSLVALVAGKRKPPHVERFNLTIERGLILKPEQFKNSRKMLSLQQGGYMTLAQFAMIFWHDLAAPILAGIITAAIVGWWRNRK